MTDEIKAYKGGRTRKKLKKKARERERLQRVEERKTQQVVDALDGKQGFKVEKDYYEINWPYYKKV